MKSNNFPQRLGILLLVVVLLAGGGWLWWKDATAAADPTDKTPVVFVIKKGESVKSIASRLDEQGLIRSSPAFFLLIKLLGIERDLQAGDFRLNRSMDAAAVARELTHGMLDVWVTLLEGWRVEEMATKIARELDIPEAQFLAYAREGYMFPDTYLIPRDATPAAVANIFLANFDKKITSQMREDAKKSGLTLREVIILASIVEREGRTDSDRPVIAGILLKRLKAGWPLQADATLQYALGYQPNEKSWWKKSLTEADKKIKSPYNTYARAGLPPGPISNPGLAAIRAVIYPTTSDYWYYLHDLEGGVHFARTIEEHNQNIAKYLLQQ
ncbi:MAG: endolytic transglycosylase MltG [Patescibacteria group bacterium]